VGHRTYVLAKPSLAACIPGAQAQGFTRPSINGRKRSKRGGVLPMPPKIPLDDNLDDQGKTKTDTALEKIRAEGL
jgi:hypothetical protein